MSRNDCCDGSANLTVGNKMLAERWIMAYGTVSLPTTFTEINENGTADTAGEVRGQLFRWLLSLGLWLYDARRAADTTLAARPQQPPYLACSRDFC